MHRATCGMILGQGSCGASKKGKLEGTAALGRLIELP